MYICVWDMIIVVCYSSIYVFTCLLFVSFTVSTFICITFFRNPDDRFSFSFYNLSLWKKLPISVLFTNKEHLQLVFPEGGSCFVFLLRLGSLVSTLLRFQLVPAPPLRPWFTVEAHWAQPEFPKVSVSGKCFSGVKRTRCLCQVRVTRRANSFENTFACFKGVVLWEKINRREYASFLIADEKLIDCVVIVKLSEASLFCFCFLKYQRSGSHFYENKIEREKIG